MTLDLPTLDTLDEHRRVLEALTERLDQVKSWVARYPVFLRVAGTTQRFERPSDVDELVVELQRVTTLRWALTICEALGVRCL